MHERPVKTPLQPGKFAHAIACVHFQNLFDNTSDMAIHGCLADGTIVYWNHGCEQLFGYRAAEALGRKLHDLIVPQASRPESEMAMEKMFRSGQGLPFSRRELLNRAGMCICVDSCHTLVALPGRSPVLFSMDIDQSKTVQDEKELRIAAAAFESQQGMLITNPRGVILRINEAFTATTGYTAVEVVGQTPRILRSGRHPPEFYAELWQTITTTGSWQGEICNRHKDGEIHTDWVTITAVKDCSGQVSHYVGTQTDITGHKDIENQIVQLAFYDSLTRLPNRRLLQDRIEHALRSNQRKQCYGALLFIDVDHFKTLNNSLGHDIGNLLLQQVAARLQANVSGSDTVARLGGDEFVVMLEDIGSDLNGAITHVESVGQKILAVLAQPHILRHSEYHGSASIGITLFPLQQTGFDELMRQADLAMYEAKGAGRNTLRFYDAEMQAAVTHHAEMISGLREGLARKQFVLHYQPQVDCRGQVVGAEALLRWDRPGIGRVLPAAFVSVAEDSGLIQQIGNWVLKAACTQLARWAMQPETAGLTLAVNVSASQFLHADFVEQVLEIINRTGASPQRLKLELTESMLITRIDEVIERMSALRKIGIHFSLDDFGTGYSSLAYLQRLPLDQLKIDQSFVRNLLTDANSVVIAQTIVALGRSMGLSVIAEGVEEEGQRQMLKKLGCDSYQGYLYGRPMPLREFQTLLLQHDGQSFPGNDETGFDLDRQHAGPSLASPDLNMTPTPLCDAQYFLTTAET